MCTGARKLRSAFLVSGIWILGSLPLSAGQETNGLRPWQDYATIMWIGDSAYQKPEKLPLFFQRLREMGINTAMVYGDGNLTPLLENHFPYYVENMVNRGLCLKFNSKVTDWDKFVTAWVKDGRPETAFVRDYCLDDPQWRGWARTEVQSLVRKNREHSPLAYNIRDELSTTISANPFDYDFNPITLAQFREWLRTQYPDLAALNAEWETQFNSWDEVKPFSTDQIKSRMAGSNPAHPGKLDWGEVRAARFDPATARQNATRWNFSPWADFRSYMDISLARALGDLRHAAHELDSKTPVGIEGTQMPHAFGGYDLWRLSQALDWVEPYDISCVRDILGSFMPGQPILTTVFEKDTDHARRRLWHLLLKGDRGCLVWWSEDCIDWKSDDYKLTPKAQVLAPALKGMTSPLAQLFLRAQPVRDPIFIHYSQPSIQVDWLFESIPDGATWIRRFSSFESDHNRQANVRAGWLKALQDLGYSPQFISTEQIEAGKLDSVDKAALILPSSWALTDKETAQMGRLLQNANRVILYDGAPGLFDGHGKLRINNYAVFPSENPEVITCVSGHTQVHATNDVARYLLNRFDPQAATALPNWIKEHMLAIPVDISIPVTAHARVHRFQIPGARLVAIERNVVYQMSESLAQAGGNEPLEKPVELDATLPRPMHVYDLRAQKHLGRTDRIHFTLDPWQPSLFALTDAEVRADSIVTALSQK